MINITEYLKSQWSYKKHADRFYNEFKNDPCVDQNELAHRVRMMKKRNTLGCKIRCFFVSIISRDFHKY